MAEFSEHENRRIQEARLEAVRIQREQQQQQRKHNNASSVQEDEEAEYVTVVRRFIYSLK